LEGDDYLLDTAFKTCYSVSVMDLTLNLSLVYRYQKPTFLSLSEAPLGHVEQAASRGHLQEVSCCLVSSCEAYV
jgi:hypothetical protein